DRWLERNAQYREQTVSAEFGGQTVADMVDTIYPSLYTFFFDNVRSSSRHYHIELDVAANTLTAEDASYLEADMVRLRVTKGGWLNNELEQLKDYYIVNRDGNTFQVSLTQDGPAIDFNSTYSGEVYGESFDVWDRMKLDRNVLDWQTYARENISEARKFGDKDVVPWLSPSIQGLGQNYLSGDFFRQQLETIKELGESVVLFDLNGQSQNKGWWTALTDFMDSLDDSAATLKVDFDELQQAQQSDPTPRNDVLYTDEDRPITITRSQLLANDTGVTNADIKLATSPRFGSLTQNSNGEFIYQPNPNFHGTESFTYRLFDGDYQSPTATVFVNVSSVNDNPLAASDAFSMEDTETLIITEHQLLANDRDIDSSSLQVQILTGPNNGVLDASTNGVLTYRANDGFSGSDQIIYRLFDGEGYSEAATISIDVQSTKSIANADTIITLTGTAVSIPVSSLLGNDTVPGHIQPDVQLTTKPKHGKIVWATDGSSFTYTPLAGFSGTDYIDYQLVSEGSDSNVARIAIHVGDIEIPIVSDDSFEIQQGGGLNVPLAELTRNDKLFGTSLTDVEFELITSAQHGTVTVTSDYRLHYSPDAGFHGTDSIQYRIVNEHGSSEIATVELVVTPRTVEPVAVDDSFNVPSGGGVNVSVTELLSNDTGDASDGLTIELVGTASHGVATITPDGRLHYSPARDFVGTDRVSYRLMTANGVSDLATITFTVGDGDQASEIQQLTHSFGIKQGGGVNVAVESVFANAQSVAVVDGPDHGVATITPDGRLHYSPQRDYLGTDRIIVGIENPNGTVVTSSVDFLVYPDVASVAETTTGRAASRSESLDTLLISETLEAVRHGHLTPEQISLLAAESTIADNSDEDDSDLFEELLPVQSSDTTSSWAAKLAQKLNGS
ncbi:MAG: tandem-95 repeat protein, partial [Planctomycetales bacterium]|nr:tandem-95 repeat protein [Planctomycetales bacterium]